MRDTSENACCKNGIAIAIRTLVWTRIRTSTSRTCLHQHRERKHLLFLLRQRPWSVACLGGQQAAAMSARCDWPIDRSISICGRHPRYDPWAGPEWLTAPLPHGRRPHHKSASRIQFARRLASALALCWRRMNAAPVEGSVSPASVCFTGLKWLHCLTAKVARL